MSEDNTPESSEDLGINKSRGPAYPYLDLPRALERIDQMVSKGLNAKHVVPPATVYGYWGMGAKSSASRQTMAALKYYGLLEYVGVGKDRRVRLTDSAMVLAHDKDKNSRRRIAALREAALSPEIFREIYTEQGGPHLPTDESLVLELTLDRGFDKESAEKAVKHFKSTIEIAGLDQIEESSPFENVEETKLDDSTGIDHKFGGAKVGDLVQWESQGLLQFPSARKVNQLSPDEQFVGVEGSDTWIPMSQILVTSKSILPIPPAHRPLGGGAQNLEKRDDNKEYKVDKFATLEGDVSLSWPIALTMDSVDDVEDWTKLIFKKLRREILRRDSAESVAKPADQSDDEVSKLI
jgi:hypothetical protein